MVKKKILSIDYGRKNIGISISDTTNSIAFIRDSITNDDKAIQKINQLIQDENIGKIIYGKNLNPNPNFNLELETKSFLNKITHQIPTECLNEDFSTFEAIEKLKSDGFNKEEIKKLKDSVAAQLILEKYLQSLGEC